VKFSNTIQLSPKCTMSMFSEVYEILKCFLDEPLISKFRIYVIHINVNEHETLSYFTFIYSVACITLSITVLCNPNGRRVNYHTLPLADIYF
jgi:hypothetical protein